VKKMLINATHPEENRVAIVEDGLLTELDIEISGKEQTKGNIYKGTVVRVEAGLQAAFIDFGSERLGFLQMGELHPKFFEAAAANPEIKGRPRITDILHRGQEILVQVVKEERGTKGAALTTHISLPGRYMVMMPESNTRGVSRKIESESQRKKLREQMDGMDLPENMGYIIRTAALDQDSAELKRDFDYLVRLFENIVALGTKTKAPALIFKESNLVIRSIRDYFSEDMEEVLVDDQRVFREARDFFNMIMPEFARLVKLHQEKRPIFSRYQIEEQIETIFQNKISLPSGGSIVIDSTEALVAVDVNSGKMATEQGVEATATKTNLEAAAEVARQLRLRDLGGLIVIDFIDMRDRKHIKDVERCLKNALKSDKARVTVGHISQFGLLEMSRQRIRQTLAEGSYQTCPHCQGRGKVKSVEAQSVALLRKIQAGLAKGSIGRVEGEIPLEVANYLLNNKRRELHALEHQHNVDIHIRGLTNLKAGEMELNFLKKEKEEKIQDFVDASAALLQPAEAPLTEEEPLVSSEGEIPSADVAIATEAQAAPPAEPSKKRGRSRWKKKREEKAAQPDEKKLETESAEQVTTSPTEEAAEWATAASETLPTLSEAEAAVPRSETTPIAQPASREGAEATAQAVSPEEAAAGAQSAAADKPAQKPSRSRRSRRSGRAKAPATLTESAALTEPTVASAAPTAQTAEPTETAPLHSPAKAEPVQTEIGAGIEPKGEKAEAPKPARKRRRTPAKKKAVAATASEQAPKQEVTAPSAGENKPASTPPPVAIETKAVEPAVAPKPEPAGPTLLSVVEKKGEEVKKPARKRPRRATKKPAAPAETAKAEGEKATSVDSAKTPVTKEKSSGKAVARPSTPEKTTPSGPDVAPAVIPQPTEAKPDKATPAKKKPTRPKRPRTTKAADKPTAKDEKPSTVDKTTE